MSSYDDLKNKRDEIEELVVEVQNGDHDAFAKLYDLFVDSIYRYVFYRVNDDDAEDIVETVFLKVWEHIGKYKKAKNTYFSSWIFRIAHNLVVDHYRANKDKEMNELDEQVPDHKREHNPIKVTENAIDQQNLKKALSKMKRQYRDILIYRFVNELSNQEISEILKKSEGSLRILQHRALKALKKELEDMGIHYDI